MIPLLLPPGDGVFLALQLVFSVVLGYGVFIQFGLHQLIEANRKAKQNMRIEAEHKREVRGSFLLMGIGVLVILTGALSWIVLFPIAGYAVLRELRQGLRTLVG